MGVGVGLGVGTAVGVGAAVGCGEEPVVDVEPIVGVEPGAMPVVEVDLAPGVCPGIVGEITTVIPLLPPRDCSDVVLVGLSCGAEWAVPRKSSILLPARITSVSRASSRIFRRVEELLRLAVAGSIGRGVRIGEETWLSLVWMVGGVSIAPGTGSVKTKIGSAGGVCVSTRTGTGCAA